MSNSKRWDLAISSKDKRGEWRSQRVGVVFEGDRGQLQIRIDPGISISTPEGVLLTGWVPKPRDERGGNGGRRGNDEQGGGGSTGDDIPF